MSRRRQKSNLNWNDPEYVDGDEVTVYHEEQQPVLFMLEGELEPVHLYGRLVLTCLMLELAGWLLEPQLLRLLQHAFA